jgi:hypothetical protein
MAGTFKYPVIKPLCDRTAGEKEEAQRNDKRSHEILRGFCKIPCNLECADCTAKNPGWATLPHGAFICIDCAQIHRHIGRHISQVKAINTGTYLWYPDEIEAMRLMGNDRVQALYCAARLGAPRKPAQSEGRPAKEQYIRDKYERKRWFDPSALASPATSAAPPPTTSAAAPAPAAAPATGLELFSSMAFSTPAPAPAPTPAPAVGPTASAAPNSDDFFASFGLVSASPVLATPPAPAPTTAMPPAGYVADPFSQQKADILALYHPAPAGVPMAGYPGQLMPGYPAPYAAAAPYPAQPQLPAGWGWAPTNTR